METTIRDIDKNLCESNIEHCDIYVKVTLANGKDECLTENYKEIGILIPRELEQLERDFEYLDNKPYIVGCKFIEKGCNIFASKISEIVEEIIENAEVSLQDIINLYGVIKQYDYLSKIKLLAVIESKEEETYTIKDIINYAKNLKGYNLLPDINDYNDMGKYLVNETGHFDEVSLLEDYIDYERLARDYTKNGCLYSGEFTEYGYLMKKEFMEEEKEIKNEEEFE